MSQTPSTPATVPVTVRARLQRIKFLWYLPCNVAYREGRQATTMPVPCCCPLHGWTVLESSQVKSPPSQSPPPVLQDATLGGIGCGAGGGALRSSARSELATVKQWALLRKRRRAAGGTRRRGRQLLFQSPGTGLCLQSRRVARCFVISCACTRALVRCAAISWCVRAFADVSRTQDTRHRNNVVTT